MNVGLLQRVGKQIPHTTHANLYIYISRYIVDSVILSVITKKDVRVLTIMCSCMYVFLLLGSGLYALYVVLVVGL